MSRHPKFYFKLRNHNNHLGLSVVEWNHVINIASYNNLKHLTWTDLEGEGGSGVAPPPPKNGQLHVYIKV